jgi:AraC family transcriptional regulator of adaptative response/methylated-DNA-[protein]-cysteine methyltransferase
LEPRGEVPVWLADLVKELEGDPTRRWTDTDLRSMSLEPRRVRRWFQTEYGMTFHAYQRAKRLGLAFGSIRDGGDMTGAAFDHGFESVSGFREAFGKTFGETPGKSGRLEHVVVDRITTPLGPMVAGATDAGVCLLEFTDRRRLERQIKGLRRLLGCATTPGSNAHLAALREQLESYFAGTLKAFTVPLVTPGSEFQQDVGRTRSNSLRRDALIQRYRRRGRTTRSRARRRAGEWRQPHRDRDSVSSRGAQ